MGLRIAATLHDVVPSQWPDGTNTGVPSGTVLAPITSGSGITTAAGANAYLAAHGAPLSDQINSGWSVQTIFGVTVINVTDSSGNAVVRCCDSDWAIWSNSDNVVTDAFAFTVQKCKVRGNTIENASYSAMIVIGPGSLVEDTEIDGSGHTGGFCTGANGINAGLWNSSGQAHSTVRRCNIHHTEHGMAQDGEVTVVDSWIHDFLMTDATNHTECIFISAGSNNIIQHCTLGPNGGNSALVFIQNNQGNTPIGSSDINDNYFRPTVVSGNFSTYSLAQENTGLATGSPTRYCRNNVFDKAPLNEGLAIEVPSGDTYTGGTTTSVAWDAQPVHTGGAYSGLLTLYGNTYADDGSPAVCEVQGTSTDFFSP